MNDPPIATIKNGLVENNILTSNNSKLDKLFALGIFEFSTLIVFKNEIQNFLLTSADGSSVETSSIFFSFYDLSIVDNAFSLEEYFQLFFSIQLLSTVSIGTTFKLENAFISKNQIQINSFTDEKPFLIR